MGRRWDVIVLQIFPLGSFPAMEGFKSWAGWLVGAGSAGWVSPGPSGFGPWPRSTKHLQGSSPGDGAVPLLSPPGCSLPVEVMGWQPLGFEVVP